MGAELSQVTLSEQPAPCRGVGALKVPSNPKQSMQSTEELCPLQGSMKTKLQVCSEGSNQTKPHSGAATFFVVGSLRVGLGFLECFGILGVLTLSLADPGAQGAMEAAKSCSQVLQQPPACLQGSPSVLSAGWGEWAAASGRRWPSRRRRCPRTWAGGGLYKAAECCSSRDWILCHNANCFSWQELGAPGLCLQEPQERPPGKLCRVRRRQAVVWG